MTDETLNVLSGVLKKIKELYLENGDSYCEIRGTSAEYQSAIGESWHLMYELVRYYSIVNTPQKKAYQILADLNFAQIYNSKQ